MQSIVSKGKDLNQAIQVGLSLLESSETEVDIEIIQNETKGFLRLGSKEAIVKLTKKNETASLLEKERVTDIEAMKNQQEEKALLEESVNFSNSSINDESGISSGKVWVKNGSLFCQSTPSHFPKVTIPDTIKLYKNNEVVKEKTTTISQNDIHEIKVENEEIETVWNITMDQHELKVFLHVEPGYKLNRIIRDIAPEYHIELLVEEKTEILNTLNYDNVMQRLEELQVKQDPNQDEIAKALKTSEPSTFEIVTGINPKKGKDGWLEIMIELGTNEGPREMENGRVDFRETNYIPTVEKGKVIGIIHPPIPGEIGLTVRNVPLPAKETFPIITQIGKGAIVEEDKIIATESGSPKINQKGQLVKISIVPKLTHAGDVDLSSGNIRFLGDIHIEGEVGENMIVEAEGDITVNKTVNMATLTTSMAIIAYGNIVGSEITAGRNNMSIVELGHSLGILHQHMENIIGAINQLTPSPNLKSTDFSKGGLQPLIRVLLEKKFKEFPSLVKSYVENVRRYEEFINDGSWKEIANSLTKLFLTLTNEVTTIERITQVSSEMKELHFSSQKQVETDSYITVPSVLNSRIYCSGNILVLGQGCINSKIHAGGTLKITGILRGGEVYGRLGVEVNVVGAESGTTTLISVPMDQKIRIEKAMVGTTLMIGNVKHIISETRHHVEASLDRNHQLILQ